MGAIGDLVEAARAALERGDQEELGLLFYRNHAALQRLGVSSPGLDALVEAARGAGALGAKLTGAGKGGHALVLVDQESQARVRGPGGSGRPSRDCLPRARKPVRGPP